MIDLTSRSAEVLVAKHVIGSMQSEKTLLSITPAFLNDTQIMDEKSRPRKEYVMKARIFYYAGKRSAIPSLYNGQSSVLLSETRSLVRVLWVTVLEIFLVFALLPTSSPFDWFGSTEFNKKNAYFGPPWLGYTRSTTCNLLNRCSSSTVQKIH